MVRALHTLGRGLARAVARPGFLGWVACLGLSAGAVGAYAQEQTAPSVPKIYKWIDENGIAHYTTDVERIPKSIRDQIGRGAGAGDNSQGGTQSESEVSPPSTRRSASDRGFSQDAKPEPVEREFDDGGEGTADASVLQDLDERIAALEAEIAGDEELLKALISRGGEDTGSGDEQVATLRDLSGRLPQALEELEALRAERAALSP